MDSYSAACLEELADLMTLWNVEPRVEVNQWETPSVDELITEFRQMCETLRRRRKRRGLKHSKMWSSRFVIATTSFVYALCTTTKL
ncbi:hypothetical protein Tco_0849874 [Tanacetum coccineum]